MYVIRAISIDGTSTVRPPNTDKCRVEYSDYNILEINVVLMQTKLDVLHMIIIICDEIIIWFVYTQDLQLYIAL